jgi:hypothetical protein
MINLRKTLTTASVTSLLTAAILVTASSLVTSPSRLGGIAAYAQEGDSTLEIEIESASWDPRTKQVTVEFTATCSGDLSEGSWFVEVTQIRGGKVHYCEQRF